jgi:hypothetical protein
MKAASREAARLLENQRKREQKAHAVEQGKNRPPIHPIWLLVIGIGLTALALGMWSFLL